MVLQMVTRFRMAPTCAGVGVEGARARSGAGAIVEVGAVAGAPTPTISLIVRPPAL